VLKIFQSRLLTGLLAISLIGIGCSTGFSSQKEKTAPDFSLKSLDGQTITLSQFRGRPVVINFWASWCQPCRDEIPFLQQVYNKYNNMGLVFFAIDIGENPETINRYFKDNGLFMPVLLDSNKQVSQDYGITGVPETFFIDKNGIIRKWQIGAYPSVQAIEDDLKIIMP